MQLRQQGPPSCPSLLSTPLAEASLAQQARKISAAWCLGVVPPPSQEVLHPAGSSAVADVAVSMHFGTPVSEVQEKKGIFTGAESSAPKGSKRGYLALSFKGWWGSMDWC